MKAREIRIGRPGQALLEYVLAVAALLVVVAILGGLVVVAKNHASRAQGLVRMEYP